MPLRALVVRMIGGILRVRDRGAPGVLAAVVSVGVVGVGGAGTAHAQVCDPIETARLLVGDGAVDDSFGNAVSIDGDTAVIGAWNDDNGNGDNAGSAYVFTRSNGVWIQQAKLVPLDGAENDYFGTSVSIRGDTVVIGAYGDEDNGTLSGSAYVFTRSGGVWTQQAKLLPNDGAQEDYFSWSVSLSGDTVIVGAWGDDDNGSASGSAYVFTRSGSDWTQQAKLLSTDGAFGDFFGSSVSISGETAVIGAYGNGDNGSFSGSAYVFTRNSGIWAQQDKLLPTDGETRNSFGISVSLSGDTAVIGAYLDHDNGAYSGSAYIFTHIGGVWTQQAKLLSVDGETLNLFGFSVSIDGDTAVIGAYGDEDNGTDSGSAYVFIRRSMGVWIQRAKPLPADGAEGDEFGKAVSLSGNTVIIGSIGDDNNGTDSGSAYIFDLNCNDCPADLNGDGIVTTQDFQAFLGAWSAGDPLADWNGDGDINTLDFLAYLADWSAGC